jgi:DNA (cytosine-5)-methyltransferase 1
MLTPQYQLDLAGELVVDLFAGGGGASTGIEQAIGRHVDIAVNHDPEAISLHEANHPQTRHFVSDVFEVDPLTVTDGRPVGLLWASPDCKHFSKAKGAAPRSKKIRALAWVVIKWAKTVAPRVICLENVEEFQTWGPLNAEGAPCPARKGHTFKRWLAQPRNLGYAVEWRELRACDYGAPTIRKRLFLVARRDGMPIVWPAPTHAAKPTKDSGLKAWRTAAECIDWSLPCPSIFERERPLAEATQRRIAHGVKRYVIDAARPFIVPVTHQGDSRVHSIDEPLRTITTAQRGELALAVPTLAALAHSDNGRKERPPADIHAPVSTIHAGGGNHALCAAFLSKHFGGEPQAGKTAAPLTAPAPTVLASGGPQGLTTATLVHLGHGEGPDGKARFSHGVRDIEDPLNTASGAPAGLVTCHLAKLRGTSNSADAAEPLGTVSAQGTHHAEVRALLIKYYGTDQDPNLTEPLHTVTTKDRFALATVKGVDYLIADIGMRMLQPRELYRAQGFPESYRIDRGHDGRLLSKAAQVRMCGNSVCPPMARALVLANYSERQALKEAA